MTRLVWLAPLLTACATTSTVHDREVVERFIALPTAAPLEQVEVGPLTLERAVELALTNHPEASAVLRDLGVSRGQWVQAGLVPNPEVEFEVRDPGGAQPAQLDLGLELNLTAMVLAPVRASVAEAAFEAERLRTAGLLLDLAWRARVAFLEVQAAQERLALRLNFLESQQASYAAALELSKAGNLPALELANELTQVELARVQVAESENALLDAKEALHRALGLSGEQTQWTIAAPLALPDEAPAADDAESRAVTASLELLELERRIESARRKVGLTTSEGWLPHISGGFHGERDGELWELGAHVAISLPVFDRAQGRTLSAESELAALKLRRERAAIQVRSAVRSTLNRVESAGRRARHYAQRLGPARQQQLAQTVLQYNAMQLGVFQVLQVQRTVTETALAQVDATLDYWKARVAFDLLLAGRSSPLGTDAVPSSSSTSATASAGH